MRGTTTAALWIIRLGVLVELVLGLLVWAGRGTPGLVSLHIQIGFLIVLALLALAVVALAAGAPRGRAVGAIAWAVLLPVVGFGQLRWMPGTAHWVVQLLHLLLGLGAAGLAEPLARRVLARGAARPA
ncbi:MAG: hypothetical protein ACJ79S_20870 [Gemmatimonadaceae bacterium]